MFCLPEHIDGEVASFCELLGRVYARFGFQEFGVGFSTRPEVREGSDSLWDEAEATLKRARLCRGLHLHPRPRFEFPRGQGIAEGRTSPRGSSRPSVTIRRQPQKAVDYVVRVQVISCDRAFIVDAHGKSAAK